MLLIYTRKWKYKIETVHVQHAGLYLMQIFFLFVCFNIYSNITKQAINQ